MTYLEHTLVQTVAFLHVITTRLSCDITSYNRTLLVHLNDTTFNALMPVVVYLLILMLMGTVGNSLVIYVYGWSLKSSTQNFLFTWLAVVDLMTCIVGMPSEVVDLRNQYLYENSTACSVMKFLLVVPAVASVNLLMFIAIDRFQRVCNPLHQQMKQFQAKMCVLMSFFIAVVVAGPSVFLYGKGTVKTPVENVSGIGCSIQDEYKGTVTLLVYQVFLATSTFLYAGIIAFLYFRIWLEAGRHSSFVAQNSFSSLFSNSSYAGRSDKRNRPSARTESGTVGSSLEMTEQRSAESRRTDAHRRMIDKGLDTDSTLKERRVVKASKMAMIAMAVSIVFFVSYTPHVCLMIVRTVAPHFNSQQTGIKLILFSMFVRSYFVNCVANVFIYALMCTRFRQQCKRVLCLCCPRL